MKRIIKLTESDLTRIVKQVINENNKEVNEIFGLQKFKRDERPSDIVNKGKFTLLTFERGGYFTIAKNDKEFLILDKGDIKNIEYLLDTVKQKS